MLGLPPALLAGMALLAWIRLIHSSKSLVLRVESYLPFFVCYTVEVTSVKQTTVEHKKPSRVATNDSTK